MLGFLQPQGHHADSPKRSVSPPPGLSLLTLPPFMGPESLYPWFQWSVQHPTEREQRLEGKGVSGPSQALRTRKPSLESLPSGPEALGLAGRCPWSQQGARTQEPWLQGSPICQAAY